MNHYGSFGTNFEYKNLSFVHSPLSPSTSFLEQTCQRPLVEATKLTSHDMQMLSPLTPVPSESFNSPQSDKHLSLPQELELDELGEENPGFLPITMRKDMPTGTRKNPRTATLVPANAPTQPRTYVSPSATSRREIPDSYTRTSQRRTAQKRRYEEESEDDEELLAELPPNPTEIQKIEYKRRQNTLAARKSRRRKLEHQQELERTIVQLENEVMVWKIRARTLYELVKTHNIPYEGFDEAELEIRRGR
jgi:hypothetical protein